MPTLGLDPSMTGFGYCIVDSDQTGPDRVVVRGRWKTNPTELWISRYCTLRAEVEQLLSLYPSIHDVGVESPPFGAGWSEGLYALFSFVNEAIWKAKRNVVWFDPITVKMLAKQDPKSHDGKMFKSDMKKAAQRDTGIQKWNADEADAYHIGFGADRFWRFLRGELKESDLTISERHAFTRVEHPTKGKDKGKELRKGLIYKEDKRFYRFCDLTP